MAGGLALLALLEKAKRKKQLAKILKANASLYGRLDRRANKILGLSKKLEKEADSLKEEALRNLRPY